jgi:chromosome segregation ATPase
MVSTTRRLCRPLPLVALLAGLLGTHGSVLAQADGTRTLGGSTKAGGKVMTRDELRACMKQQDELDAQRKSLEARRVTMNQERDAIQADNEAVKAQQEEIKARNQGVRDYNERMKAYAERVDAYNEKMREFQEETRTGPMLERKRRELEKEKAELQRMDAANKAEGEKLQGDLASKVEAVNAKVEAQGKRAADWNSRNKALEDEANAYEDKRVDWKLNCGDRRYREDDEKAIRAGK